MKWYNGGISDAIVYSKSKGAVFVVYIEGTDEKSQKITQLIDNGELGQKLQQDHFVAVKLGAGSTPHQQFSEIYKEPSVPSLYFIGKNGVPLDIITGNNNLDEITSRLDDILSRAGISGPATQSNSASVLSENFIKQEQSSAIPKVECDNNACKIVDDKPTEGESSQKEQAEVSLKEDGDLKTEQNMELSADEKLQKAKELIELKRQQKEKEEKENERLKELERRKMGQNVQQLKKWQEDEDLKQLKEERDREKRENQLAKERVLAQIAQDRAERLAKTQFIAPKVSPKASPSSPKPPSNVTRLQFKLPDSSSVIQEFEVSDTLECVASYLRSNLHITLSSFTLVATFPKREFTESDYHKTLANLELFPNAVLFVLPNNGTVSTSSEGFVASLIWGLLTPIFSLLGYIKRFVFGSDSSNRRSNVRPPPNEPTEGSTGIVKKPRLSPGDSSTVVKRTGNIHRLADQTDSDDENNTWNGNSTQQM